MFEKCSGHRQIGYSPMFRRMNAEQYERYKQRLRAEIGGSFKKKQSDHCSIYDRVIRMDLGRDSDRNSNGKRRMNGHESPTKRKRRRLNGDDVS